MISTLSPAWLLIAVILTYSSACAACKNLPGTIGFGKAAKVASVNPASPEIIIVEPSTCVLPLNAVKSAVKGVTTCSTLCESTS